MDLLPATIIMRIEKIFSLSVSEATLPNPTLKKIITTTKGKRKIIVLLMVMVMVIIHLVMQVMV